MFYLHLHKKQTINATIIWGQFSYPVQITQCHWMHHPKGFKAGSGYLHFHYTDMDSFLAITLGWQVSVSMISYLLSRVFWISTDHLQVAPSFQVFDCKKKKKRGVISVKYPALYMSWNWSQYFLLFALIWSGSPCHVSLSAGSMNLRTGRLQGGGCASMSKSGTVCAELRELSTLTPGCREASRNRYTCIWSQ